MGVFRLGDPCALCSQPILRGQGYSVFSDFLPSWSSLAYVSGKAAHLACYDAWPFVNAFDALMKCFEEAQMEAQRLARHGGYDFECDCDRLDPFWPGARAGSLEARCFEHDARCREEWATKYADVPLSRRPTIPPPPPDPNEPVLERLHPEIADAEIRRHDRPPPLSLIRCP
jgi:hypothetical protein